ncbi:DUF6704 family protein [Glaciihabitans sp. dw_435]|uniref:DUF6704 family protein n=1 Tax=Glaciihabitans sp. dw_435 TaxID=2720081 RepID=UPI001C4A501A|nr:DUF6704 family protein [Glaciihabitans sp. dw_435]
MSEEVEDHEGKSPAAWTAVFIMLLAFTIGTFAFWFDKPIIVWLSVIILAIGPIVGWMMARAGYGVNGAKTTHKAHS